MYIKKNPSSDAIKLLVTPSGIKQRCLLSSLYLPVQSNVILMEPSVKQRRYKHIIHHYYPLAKIMIFILTPLILCVLILYMSCGTNSLKWTPNDRCFEKHFMVIYSLFRVLQTIYWQKATEEILFHIPVCWRCMSCLISQHPTYKTTVNTSCGTTRNVTLREIMSNRRGYNRASTKPFSSRRSKNNKPDQSCVHSTFQQSIVFS